MDNPNPSVSGGDSASFPDAVRDGVSSRQSTATTLSKELSIAIGSNMFWNYCRFISLIAGCLDDLSCWCESCPCHSKTRLSTFYDDVEDPERRTFAKRRRKREATIKREAAHEGVAPQSGNQWLSPETITCKFRGRRAPELACGVFGAFVETLTVFAKSEIIVLSDELPADQAPVLLNDYYYAVVSWVVELRKLLTLTLTVLFETLESEEVSSFNTKITVDLLVFQMSVTHPPPFAR